MSLKEEIEELSRECKICGKHYARNDKSSTGECPSCHDYDRKSELAHVMTDTMQVLAGMSDSERFDVLRTRLRSFLDMEPELRVRELTDMLDAMAELEQFERSVMEKAIGEVLQSLPEGEARVLMDALDSIVDGWSRHDKKGVMKKKKRSRPGSKTIKRTRAGVEHRKGAGKPVENRAQKAGSQ